MTSQLWLWTGAGLAQNTRGSVPISRLSACTRHCPSSNLAWHKLCWLAYHPLRATHPSPASSHHPPPSGPPPLLARHHRPPRPISARPKSGAGSGGRASRHLARGGMMDARQGLPSLGCHHDGWAGLETRPDTTTTSQPPGLQPRNGPRPYCRCHALLYMQQCNRAAVLQPCWSLI